MDDQTIFYIFGGVLIVSAAVVAALASKGKFPGKLVPLIAVWFAVLALGAATFAVLNGVDDSSAPEESQEYAIHGEAESAASEEATEEGVEENEETGEKNTEAESGVDGAGEEIEGEAAGSETEGGDASQGTVVFSENCSTCHGATGEGGNGGPDLLTMPLAKTEAGAIEQVTNGGGGMPAFKGTLSEEEIENVAAYVVQEITHGE
jgi:mono/diheme cytochrome c family protein